MDKDGSPLKFYGATEWVGKGVAKGERTTDHGQAEYLVLPEAFKRTVCKGWDAAAVAKVLRAAGHLVTQKDRLTNKVWIPTMGEGTVSVYHVRGSIFEAE